MTKYKRQSGFTLIEIAMVLVIIGLLIGGILKGQEVIQNAKYKRFLNDKNGITAAVYTYLDRYKGMPGDHAAASSLLQGASNGNGNGQLNGAEVNYFWDHLRRAGLIESVGPNLQQAPQHTLGGRIVVRYRAFGINKNMICFEGIMGKDARLLDLQIDDGNPRTGELRAHTSIVNTLPASSSYNDNSVYSMCTTL